MKVIGFMFLVETENGTNIAIQSVNVDSVELESSSPLLPLGIPLDAPYHIRLVGKGLCVTEETQPLKDFLLANEPLSIRIVNTRDQ